MVSFSISTAQAKKLFEAKSMFFIIISPQNITISYSLNLVLLNQIYPAFANSVDPDQLASDKAN